MTTASHVAVVATQLAQTDRRALSQAWYSALHLAPAGASRSHGAAPGAAARAVGNAPAVAAQPGAAGPHGDPAAIVRRAVRGVPAPAFADRRRLPDPIARRLERAVERMARAPHAAGSQTVVVDGKRVTLLVRTDRATTRVVALCSEPLRAQVERALAHARFALACAGGAVRGS